MSRKKRTAGDEEDVPVVQKRVKTRAQTQQRLEEEAQGLIAKGEQLARQYKGPDVPLRTEHDLSSLVKFSYR